MTDPTAAAPAITLVPSIFTGPGQDGDFVWMLAQPKYARALFVFNDNEAQFLAFQSGIQPGAGNGVIRPFQADHQRAAGVPTGPGYLAMTPHIQGIIDQATAHIKTLLATGKYDMLIYSSDKTDPGMVGTGTFVVGDDVRRAVASGLRALVPVVAPN